MPLPPGQRFRRDFPRFGLPQFANRIPTIPAEPTISIHLTEEADKESWVIGLPELSTLERIERISDFHCVTTWSVENLRWGGWAFADVLRTFVIDTNHTNTSDSNLFVVVRGLDGFGARLLLQDALDPSVMLADSLDGEPLAIKHGAPLRLVAPRHYGFKNVKHLKSIEICRRGNEKLRYGRMSFLEHPRGRVDLEERGGLPGRFLRYLYRPLINRTARQFRKALDRYES